MQLSWKIALITWWTAWIGFAIAEAFCKAWSSVIVSYMHNQIRAKEVEKKLSLYWTKVLVMKANSGKKEDLEFLFQEAAKLWNIDILVNNVGTVSGDNDGKSEWEKAFFHQVMWTVDACDLFEKQVVEWEKVIINITSVAWTDPLLWHKVARNEAYCCLKWAVNTLTQIRANKYDGKIRVCAIAPWNTLTESWKWKDEKIIEARLRGTLIHRFVTPQEIAKTALHIVDNDALNWQVLIVDGWIVAKGYEQ